jgi:hypothetical protein
VAVPTVNLELWPFLGEIYSETEVCNFCTTSCKLKVARNCGEKVRLWFSFGRDYDTKHFVDKKIFRL